MFQSGISNCEYEFTQQALHEEGVRVDGRSPLEYRKMSFRFSNTFGDVEVNYGSTWVKAVCSGDVVVPKSRYPNEGHINFDVKFATIGAVDDGRALTLKHLLGSLLKKTVDVKALCIIKGQKVWSIRVDILALVDDGNLSDACAVAALVALLHFQQGTHTPVFASISKVYVPVSFAIFAPLKDDEDAEPALVLDPTRSEEAVMNGVLYIAVNQASEICDLYMPGGFPMKYESVRECIELAVESSERLTQRWTEALEGDMKKREDMKAYEEDGSSMHMATPEAASPTRHMKAKTLNVDMNKRRLPYNGESDAEFNFYAEPERSSGIPAQHSFLDPWDIRDEHFIPGLFAVVSFILASIGLKKLRNLQRQRLMLM